MKQELITCHVNKGNLHAILYADFCGNLIDFIPIGDSIRKSLFIIDDLVKFVGTPAIAKVSKIEVIPPISDKYIESPFEGVLLYSSTGWTGYRYFVGVSVI